MFFPTLLAAVTAVFSKVAMYKEACKSISDFLEELLKYDVLFLGNRLYSASRKNHTKE